MPNGRLPRLAAGYTYVAMLVAVAVIGIGLSGTGIVWSQASQREKERELLFTGAQIREAIERYYERSPGVKRYPTALEDLLRDRRFPGTERHLRRIYPDPFTGKADWVVLEAPGGGIMGVHSRSTASPVKNGSYSHHDRSFQGAKTYQEWQFFYDAQPASSPPATVSPSSGALPPPLASSPPGTAPPPANSNSASGAAQPPLAVPDSPRTARAR